MLDRATNEFPDIRLRNRRPLRSRLFWMVPAWFMFLLARLVTDWYEYRQHSVKT